MKCIKDILNERFFFLTIWLCWVTVQPRGPLPAKWHCYVCCCVIFVFLKGRNIGLLLSVLDFYVLILLLLLPPHLRFFSFFVNRIIRLWLSLLIYTCWRHIALQDMVIVSPHSHSFVPETNYQITGAEWTIQTVIHWLGSSDLTTCDRLRTFCYRITELWRMLNRRAVLYYLWYPAVIRVPKAIIKHCCSYGSSRIE